MKKLVSTFIIFTFICFITIHIFFISIPAALTYDENSPVYGSSRNGAIEEALFGFIEKNMTARDGSIVTNLQKSADSSYTLSESVGLLMSYCALSGKKSVFDREVSYLKEHMLKDGKYVSWRVGKEDAACNAAIDDFRIMGALLDAYGKWNTKEYYDLAGFLQEGVYHKQVAGRSLYEFYDWKTDRSSRSIPLCYLDPYNIDRLSEFNKGWLAVEEKALSVIGNGRINSSSPFYFKYYNYDTGGYSFDEEYKKDGGICLTYTLYTALHMAEVNEENSFLTDWLKGEAGSGKLYAWYNPHTLKPVNDIESTAVYALAAAYARKVGEMQLYEQLTEAMCKFEVKDTGSRFYGGFGDVKTGYFHAFDNLTALWALALER